MIGLAIALLVIAGLQVTSALLTIALIGKRRQTITPANAVVTVITSACYTTILIMAAIAVAR
jgi:hypothetical protein